MDKELLNKAKEAENVEALLLLAEENNIEMEKEEAERIFSRLHSEGEMSEDDLESVSGGGCSDVDFSGPKYALGHFVEVGYSNCCDGYDCCSTTFEILGYNTKNGEEAVGYAYGVHWVPATKIVYSLKCARCGRTTSLAEGLIRGYSDFYGNKI